MKHGTFMTPHAMHEFKHALLVLALLIGLLTVLFTGPVY